MSLLSMYADSPVRVMKARRRESALRRLRRTASPHSHAVDEDLQWLCNVDAAAPLSSVRSRRTGKTTHTPVTPPAPVTEEEIELLMQLRGLHCPGIVTDANREANLAEAAKLAELLAWCVFSDRKRYGMRSSLKRAVPKKRQVSRPKAEQRAKLYAELRRTQGRRADMLLPWLASWLEEAELGSVLPHCRLPSSPPPGDDVEAAADGEAPQLPGDDPCPPYLWLYAPSLFGLEPPTPSPRLIKWTWQASRELLTPTLEGPTGTLSSPYATRTSSYKVLAAVRSKCLPPPEMFGKVGDQRTVADDVGKFLDAVRAAKLSVEQREAFSTVFGSDKFLVEAESTLGVHAVALYPLLRNCADALDAGLVASVFGAPGTNPGDAGLHPPPGAMSPPEAFADLLARVVTDGVLLRFRRRLAAFVASGRHVDDRQEFLDTASVMFGPVAMVLDTELRACVDGLEVDMVDGARDRLIAQDAELARMVEGDLDAFPEGGVEPEGSLGRGGGDLSVLTAATGATLGAGPWGFTAEGGEGEEVAVQETNKPRRALRVPLRLACDRIEEGVEEAEGAGVDFPPDMVFTQDGSTLEDLWRHHPVSRKVFVGGLPLGSTAAQVRQAFAACGPLTGVEMLLGRTARAAELLRAEEGDAGNATAGSRAKSYRRFLQRRQKLVRNSHNALHAFLYYDSDEGYRLATSPAMKLFGALVNGKTCKTAPADTMCTLFVGNMTKGITPAAVESLLGRVLGASGLSVRLWDSHRLRHGMVSGGSCFLRLPSHDDAVAVCGLLQGVELVSGSGLDVGWAEGQEWRQAAPRLPHYF